MRWDMNAESIAFRVAVQRANVGRRDSQLRFEVVLEVLGVIDAAV